MIGFRYHDNLRMAEGIQVKLGTSMYNDVKMNLLAYGAKRSNVPLGKNSFSVLTCESVMGV